MILVTGGAGFIGSVLVRELNKLGREDIVIVDRLRDSSKWLNLRKLKYSSYLHSDDLFSEKGEETLSMVTEVYHIGACSSTTEKNMDYLYDNNVIFSQKLFELATTKDIPIAYASSAATYGAGEHGYSDEHDKQSTYLPLNRYGYSKWLFDEWVLKQNYFPTHWYGFKFFNVYGPNEYHKGGMRSMVNKAFEQIKESELVKLFKSHKDGFADGEQLRDFVYVVDVVKAMIALMEQKDAKHSGIYNMGTGEARSFKDLVMATFKALDVNPNIEFVDMPKELRSQYQYYTKAEMDKFKSSIPDFRFHTLEEGVSDYVKNFLNTEDIYY